MEIGRNERDRVRGGALGDALPRDDACIRGDRGSVDRRSDGDRDDQQDGDREQRNPVPILHANFDHHTGTMVSWVVGVGYCGCARCCSLAIASCCTASITGAARFAARNRIGGATIAAISLTAATFCST